ncbi:histidine phosphatase family protein [Hymenobacter bucti]|uniref:Histidine phosphatase family protein n=1 Tax=Hymenobacter bucti TaxID=1844114 RepID=A0ABW4QWJ4_9BACT
MPLFIGLRPAWRRWPSWPCAYDYRFRTAIAAQQPTLVFTHGGTIRALVCHCLEMPLRNALQLQMDYASVTKLRFKHARRELAKPSQGSSWPSPKCLAICRMSIQSPVD